MPLTYHAQSGGLLSEFLLAMVLTAGLIASTGHYLTGVVRRQYHLQQQIQLRNEVLQLLLQLEKAIRRSGYCASTSCTGHAVHILSGRCLMLSWDKRKVTAGGAGVSPYNQGVSFRWSQQQIETRSGVFSHCQGLGWEKVTDPTLGKVTLFRIVNEGKTLSIDIRIENDTAHWQLTHRVNRKNGA